MKVQSIKNYGYSISQNPGVQNQNTPYSAIGNNQSQVSFGKWSLLQRGYKAFLSNFRGCGVAAVHALRAIRQGAESIADAVRKITKFLVERRSK